MDKEDVETGNCGMECVICFENITGLKIVIYKKCGHFVCKECFVKYSNIFLTGKDVYIPCHMCRDPVNKLLLDGKECSVSSIVSQEPRGPGVTSILKTSSMVLLMILGLFLLVVSVVSIITSAFT